MNTPISRISSTTRLIASLLLSVLIAAPCHAGLKEGLAAYDKADYATALKELTPLAEKGDAKAQSRLGRMYGLGQGVPQDAREAAEWFLKAAEQGVAEAQGALGYMFLMGEGTPQDHAKAFEWTRKAADQGDAMAQYNLAVMHGDAHGIRKEPAESLKWMCKAAEQGHAEALNALGAMYQHGTGGVKQDPVLAYMLFDLAAAKGSAGASSNRKALEASMTAVQIKKGKELAARWKRGTPLPKGSK